MDRRRTDRAAAEAAALYRAHAPQLLRFVRRLAALQGLAEAQLDTEGVVHEAFALMLRYQGTIANPPGWLCTVARRLVGRAHARQQRIADGDAGSLIDNGDARWTSLAPRASTEDVLAARAVMQAIAELSDRQQVATYLSIVEGWSRTEIGAYLDCAAATAGVHAHRGTRRIRDRLASLQHAPWRGALSGIIAALTALVLGVDWIRRHFDLSGIASIGGDSLRPVVWLVVGLGATLVGLTWLGSALSRRSPLPDRWPVLATVAIIWLTVAVAGINTLHHRWDETDNAFGELFAGLVDDPPPPRPPALSLTAVAIGVDAALVLLTWLGYALQLWYRRRRTSTTGSPGRPDQR
jgi:RNA polymerase sigma factor (sigma-70 family)